MSLCPEHEYRESLSDEEFWYYVYPTGYSEPDDIDELPDEATDMSPCTVCRSTGACMYDAEGRPMMHIVEDESEIS